MQIPNLNAAIITNAICFVSFSETLLKGCLWVTAHSGSSLAGYSNRIIVIKIHSDEMYEIYEENIIVVHRRRVQKIIKC